MDIEIIYKEEAFKIIGCCLDVHNNLGKGFVEVIYKDALEYKFKIKTILYEREKEFKINCKEILLPHNYYSDFTVFGKIILEI